MEKLQIKKITKGKPKQVYDLAVEDNHNFFITNQQILTHNCDYLTPNSQAILRGIMEQFSSTSRFLLTCNYPNRVIPPIHSRTQTIEIHELEINEFTAKMAEILIAENVDFEIDVLDTYVKGSWPDLRKCINNCWQNSINGILQAPTSDNNSSDYKIQAISLFKQGKIREARQLVCSQIRPEELEDFFRLLYDNLDFWGSTDAQKDQAILIIRKGLVQIPMAADAEILVAAVITELMQIQ